MFERLRRRTDGRWFGRIASAATIALAAALLTPTPALASDRPSMFHDKPVPGHAAAKVPGAGAAVSSRSAVPVESRLPKPGTFNVHVAQGHVSKTAVSTFAVGHKTKSATVTGPWSALGSTGLSVAAAAGAAESTVPAGTVNAAVLSTAQAHALGLSSVAIRLSRPDGAKAEPLAVRVPKSLLAGQLGADYASRLRWVEIPASVSGGKGEARTESGGQVFAAAATSTSAQPVAQGTDSTGSTVLSPMVSSQPMVVAATSGPVSATGTGSFAATPLNPASSWDVSAQTGDFSWQYPMRTPPAAAGPSPSLSLGYDSQSIDGETGASNNQPSALGEGWSLGASGFIERTYVSCSLDDGASGPVTTSGDLCWKTDNATISLAGHSGQLVKGSDGNWHLQSDDGSRIQHLVGASTAGCQANGTYDTDCWLLTTTDGTKYYFGRNRLPGWVSGKATTNSVWTVPVFGNDTGEPCHASTFAASSCVQAWRWNLDYVVDVHGNAEALYYNAESNKYARDGVTTVSYTRGGQLNHIDYGFTNNNAYATNAASGKVVFGYDAYGRCSDASHTYCSSEPITSTAVAPAHPTYYPDVPWDQYCAATSCTQVSPSFVTDGMLDAVTTQVLSGTAYANVDVWALGHSFPSPGDGTNPALWLTGATHTGHSGSTSLAEPITTFGGSQLQNRVWVVDGLAPLVKWRLTRISTSLGAVMTVGYAPTDAYCSPTNAATIEANAATNTHLCFPQWWVPQVTPPQSAQEDLFYKYVVGSVSTDPKTGGGNDRPQETDYSYPGTAAWRYDTSPFTPTKQRTWNQFAGFSKVEVRVGDHNTPTSQQTTDYSFFQGMDGDRASTSGGTKSVYVTGSSTVKDSRWFAGQVRESTTRNGAGGAAVSDTVNTPWASAVTASDTFNTARYVGDGTSVLSEPVSSGGNRTTTTTTSHDSNNLPYQVQVTHSDTGTSTCTTTTYAPKNTSVWLVGLPEQVAKVATTCANVATAVYPRDAISDTQTRYDGQAYNVMPSFGAPTVTAVVDSYTGSTATTAHWVNQSQTGYDGMGRVVTSVDVLGHTTRTAYTPAAGAAAGSGATTRVTVTNPAGWTTTTAYNPAWGAETAVTDQNGKVTTAAYDALGRRTAVWLPNRAQSTYPTSPSIGYAYTRSTTGPNAITTTTVGPTLASVTYSLFDGSGRQVQTQTAAEGGGTVVADTAYDAAGRVSMTDGPYWTSSVNPSTTLFVPASLQEVTPVNYTTYDGAGRVVKAQLETGGTERSETDTAYPGADRTDVTPPAGGTPTSSYANSIGQQTKLLQYLNSTPTGTSQATTYGYDVQGQMTSMADPAGNTWSWAFDVLGHQVKAVDPDTGTTTSTYDDAGNQLSSTDARGTTLSYTYDVLGRKTAQYQGAAGTGSKLASWSYDTLAKGQLTSSTSYTGSTAGVPGLAYTDTVTGYDAGYQPTGDTVSIPAGAPAFGGTSYTSSRTYNIDESLAAESLPAEGGLAAERVKYGYDGFGKVDSVGGYALYGLSSYSAIGRLAETTTNGSTGLYSDYGYDTATGLVTGIQSTTNTGSTYTSIANRAYTRDNAGNVTKAATTSATTATDTQCYSYDHLAELTAAWTPSTGDCTATPSASGLGGPAPYLDQYTYNTGTGNRLSATTVNGASSTQQVYAYPAAGTTRPHAVSTVTSTGSTNGTSTYGYDSAGDTTTRPGQTLTYDPSGRLATVKAGTSTQSEVYDASGTLLLRTDPTGSTLFLGETELHQASGSSNVSAVRTYTLAGKVIAERTTQPGVTGNGALAWLGTDVDGTADVEVDPTTGHVTRRYTDRFGNGRGSIPAWSSDHGFLNKTVDTSTGLTQLGARVYDGTIGKFLTVDPILAPGNPVQDNGYDYSANNPITFNDPSGLVCMSGGGDYLNFNYGCASNHSVAPAKGATMHHVAGSTIAVPLGVTSLRDLGSSAAAAARSGAAAAGSAVADDVGGSAGARAGAAVIGAGLGLVGILWDILNMSGDTEQAGTGPRPRTVRIQAHPAETPTGARMGIPCCVTDLERGAMELGATMVHLPVRRAAGSRARPITAREQFGRNAARAGMLTQ